MFEIKEMRMELNEKAKNIMNRREDNSYLGRDLGIDGLQYIKQLNERRPDERKVKVGATRMLMKENGKVKRGKRGTNICEINTSIGSDSNTSQLSAGG